MLQYGWPNVRLRTMQRYMNVRLRTMQRYINVRLRTSTMQRYINVRQLIMSHSSSTYCDNCPLVVRRLATRGKNSEHTQKKPFNDRVIFEMVTILCS